ncbi:hypothetical protein DA2_3881 [Desulfovibrio sp. A2]|nr:hypothetical protein DA2_3881 [Desulfovibrio sp. A2]
MREQRAPRMAKRRENHMPSMACAARATLIGPRSFPGYS